MDIRQNHLCYNETMRRYFPEKKSKDFFFLKKWERIFLEEGAEGLKKERRGRACKESGTRKGRPPKFDKKVEGDLIAENQQLKQQLQDTQMEIDYLKNITLYKVCQGKVIVWITELWKTSSADLR